MVWISGRAVHKLRKHIFSYFWPRKHMHTTVFETKMWQCQNFIRHCAIWTLFTCWSFYYLMFLSNLWDILHLLDITPVGQSEKFWTLWLLELQGHFWTHFPGSFAPHFLNKTHSVFHCAARSSGNKDMKGGFFKQDCSSLPLAVKAPPFKKFCRTNVPMAEFKSFFPFLNNSLSH